MSEDRVPERVGLPKVRGETGAQALVRRCADKAVAAMTELDQMWLRHDRRVRDELILPTYELECLLQRLSRLYRHLDTRRR